MSWGLTFLRREKGGPKREHLKILRHLPTVAERLRWLHAGSGGGRRGGGGCWSLPRRTTEACLLCGRRTPDASLRTLQHIPPVACLLPSDLPPSFWMEVTFQLWASHLHCFVCELLCVWQAEMLSLPTPGVLNIAPRGEYSEAHVLHCLPDFHRGVTF